jgi:hypothetical protein
MPLLRLTRDSFFDPVYVMPQVLEPGTVPWLLGRTVRLLGDGAAHLARLWSRATGASLSALAEAWALPHLLAKSTKGAFRIDWRDRQARATVIDGLARGALLAVEVVRAGVSDVAHKVYPRQPGRVRRLPVEQPNRDDAAGVPVASRRRADDRFEPAPRRRVAPHDREDALLDDELAQEREDARRGDVRALRRRTREDDYDDEECENARMPRRARATQGPRRPDRAPPAGFPDKVYPRQPGRGWEDEPELPAAHGRRMPRRDWR